MDGIVGIGLDLIEVERVARLLERRARAEERLFTDNERAYCRAAPTAERFAARFAAKEAVGKALGIGVLAWREIEVDGGGRPTVRLSGRTAAAAEGLGVRNVHLSLTHTAGHAAAVAVALSGHSPAEETATHQAGAPVGRREDVGPAEPGSAPMTGGRS